ncbi:MAG TPA: adenosylcobalamin-dependent ribonucleoside-diphosphate reductase [Phycisphaerae bacterium]|nr:adenosylcobalamin-dependent ribonucleoside-diphosphate reductase [Phycisphaerae bacterium]
MAVVDCANAPFMDEPDLTENARKVLEARYLKKDESGRCVEGPGELFHRVARTIANVETLYGATEIDRRRWEDRFYKLMTGGGFMPNSPTLMNAGREMGMLSACFVLPVRDSIVDIFNSIKHTALIQKAGGGTGFAFDELRPTGDYIKSSGGTTSGPISFWRAFSEATNAIQQGAFRRGANMGMMYIHHPDILKFLHAKQDLNQFTNYNISVKVTDAWMDEFLADADSPHVVRNPRNGKAFVIPRDVEIWQYTVRDLTEVDCVEPVPPNTRETYYRSPRLTGPLPEALRDRVYTKRDIWNIIVHNAWQTGEPGVVFIDRINEHNPTPALGRIEATNPCGEQPLLPYEACNLGSINLGKYVRSACTPEADVDWDAMRADIHVATRFLDNVIDANNYPLPEIERICHDNRKIGLGVMGFADALFKLGVAYNSDEGVAWGERFMKFLNDEAHRCSEELARERGCFPNWKGSIWHMQHNRVMRNAAVTTVAPTGTISIIADCSGGIEPMFSLAFIRNVLRGQVQGDKPLVEVNGTFREVAQRRGFLSDALLERIAREGTLAHIDEVPEDVKRVFVCAHDITPEWHMRMQAGFQRHCDSSISKTINFPKDATRADVEQIYSLAYGLRCKGVTVYRDQCRAQQPMSLKPQEDCAGHAAPAQDNAEEEDATGAAPSASAAAREPATVPVRTAPSPAPAPAAASDSGKPLAVPPPIEPMDLPEIVSGLRIRQMTPFGNMHVKITVDPCTNREIEIFAQLGKGGDVANSDLEAICRTASLWLRAGGGIRPLIKQWEGIGSSLQIPTRSGRIMSLPDGLACAIKKYLRAKERFGLRSLLLGEIDLRELDNPNPPPHHPQTTPVDRPVTPDLGNAPKAGVRAAPLSVDRPIDVLAARAAQRSTRAAPPQAIHGGNGNGGNGHGDGYQALETALAIAELEEATTEYVAEQAVWTEATVTEAAPVAAATASERRALTASDITAVLGTVTHRHDAATHYKVMCPECGSPLMLQEGCRKCSNQACGWAAC